MINENENKQNISASPEINPQPISTESQTVTPVASAPTFLERIKTKKFLVVGVLLVFAILITGSVGFYYFASQKSVSQDRTGSTLPTSLPESSPTPTKEEASVQYIKRQKIFEAVKLQGGSDTVATSAEDWELDVYDFYKVGTITSGKYKDSDLLLVLFKAGGPCKGASCGKPMRLRYVKNGNVVTLLTKVSYPLSFNSQDNISKVNPFKKFGLSLAVDNSLTIPILEYPKEIQGANKRQVLKAPEYLMEEDGEPDQTKLYNVFTHPLLGDIYTTKAEFSPSRSFEPEGQGGAFGSGSGTGGCRDTGCFTTNQFFAFRPDGTFLKFGYNPDVAVKDITWTDNKKTGSEYASYTVAGCSLQVLDDNSVVAPSLVNDADLVAVGKANNTGDAIYGLKDQNHKLYTEFYNTYKEYYAGPYIYPEENRQTKSFNDFINSRPIFLWRDPFGRLIRFNNNEFLPPVACEPIIYLYPQTTQRVSVAFDNIVSVSGSTPEYQNGWNVVADPKGKILNPSDNRTYPYLFWEGWSLIFPLQNKGFVVKQSEVASFLSETLPKLGLNEKEKADFMEAWLPQFSSSPYYFITFLDQSAIDRIAPLQVSPKPDTVIRVLMDTKPLEKPINVVEPEFKKVPQRSGFTVVEWGGLKR
jgi:hypothetical protein